jgi:hypothetical protein
MTVLEISFSVLLALAIAAASVVFKKILKQHAKFICCLSCVLILGVIVWVFCSPAAPTPMIGNCNIVNSTINGTINNCLTITPTPPLKFIPLDDPPPSIQAEKDGTFSRQESIRITALTNMIIVACADDVIGLHGGPNPGGILYIKPLMSQGNCVGNRYENVMGIWTIVVHTRTKNSKVNVEIRPVE